MEIYLDLILIENFIVDIFLLKITSQMLRKKIEVKREILGGILGSIYTVVMIFPSLKVFSSIPCQLLVVYGIIKIAFNDTRFIFKLKAVGIYLLEAFCLSGLCVMFSVNKSFNGISKGYEIKQYSIKYLFISIMIIYISLNRITEYVKERTIVGNLTYDIEFFKNNNRFIIKGFLDTGNELREPITNLPCIIVEEDIVAKVVEKAEYYIPYKGIGTTGKLKGFLVDNIKIREKGGTWKEIKAIICPCKEVLSKEREFNALLSRGII